MKVAYPDEYNTGHPRATSKLQESGHEAHVDDSQNRTPNLSFRWSFVVPQE